MVSVSFLSVQLGNETEMKKEGYIREATGLVRELGWYDTLALGVCGVTPGMWILSLFVWIAYLFPEGNLLISIFPISLVCALLMGLAYTYFAVQMPRSGGDYVYLSRIHPILGLIPSWMFGFIVNITAIGASGYMLTNFGLPTFMVTVGQVFNAPSWVNASQALANPMIAWVIVCLAIIFFGAVNILGLKWTARVQAIIFTVAIIGTIVGWLTLATTGPSYFASEWFKNTGFTVEDIMRIATQNGWKKPGFSVYDTMVGATYITGTSLATVWPIFPGGETRNPRRNLIIGNIGGITVAFFVYLFSGLCWYGVFGRDFVGALSYLYYSAPKAYPLAVAPDYNYLTTMVMANPTVRLVSALGWLLWCVSYLPGIHILISRNLFAWSYDRVFFPQFASVNKRTHTPIVALVFSTVCGMFFAWVVEFTTVMSYFMNWTVMVTSSFTWIGVGALVFPFVKKDWFERAPSWVKMKIGPVPVMSIVGACECALFWILTVLFIANPEWSGPVWVGSMALILSLYIWPIPWYLIVKWYHKRHYGMDIRLMYRDLPTE
jgi:APA family basic amino acid/polyamine antiporter